MGKAGKNRKRLRNEMSLYLMDADVANDVGEEIAAPEGRRVALPVAGVWGARPAFGPRRGGQSARDFPVNRWRLREQNSQRTASESTRPPPNRQLIRERSDALGAGQKFVPTLRREYQLQNVCSRCLVVEWIFTRVVA